MVVVTGFFAGGPQGTPGSYYVKAGTVVEIDMAVNTALVAFYGGAGNLVPLAGNETGDDADHAALENLGGRNAAARQPGPVRAGR